MVVRYSPQANEAVAAGRPPAASYLEMIYPFSTNPDLREQYVRFESSLLRIGLLLEDLDTFAADVAQMHVGAPTGSVAMVTAAVDTIRLLGVATQQQQVACEHLTAPDHQEPRSEQAAPAPPSSHAAALGRVVPSGEPLGIQRDLRIVGQVTWVGVRSMEVSIELSTRHPDGFTWLNAGCARFVMVMRPQPQKDGVGGAGGGSITAVPRLDIAGCAVAAELFSQGEERQRRRRQERETGGSDDLPTAQETQLLYRLSDSQREQAAAAATATAQGGGNSGGASAAAMLLPMSHTKRETVAIMHRQDRNTAANIFGGHLLRSAFEVAYCTVLLHAGSHCEALRMSDVTFLQPVPIGCVLQFIAKVVYTDGPLMRVSVQAMKHQAQDGQDLQQGVTNSFAFVFASQAPRLPRQVAPESLHEAVEYLRAHRAHLEDGYGPQFAAAPGGQGNANNTTGGSRIQTKL